MQARLQAMVGQACWHVSIGGASLPSFVLVMGDKIPRATPLQNPAQPEAFRQCRGSLELLVWSPWRLLNATVHVTSSVGEPDVDAMRSLVGVAITAVECSPPRWDLAIRFADGHELLTAADVAAEFDSWQFWSPGSHVVAGPGARLTEQRN